METELIERKKLERIIHNYVEAYIAFDSAVSLPMFGTFEDRKQRIEDALDNKRRTYEELIRYVLRKGK